MRRRTRRGSWMLVAILAMLVPSAARAGLISEAQELQMGAQAAQEIEARYSLSKNPAHAALVAQLGKQIAASSDRPKLPWEFRVLDTPEVNALSVPGHVYVNTGLLEFVGKDRDALAAVVAHEIAHTTRRHAVRQMEKALVGSLALRFLFKDQDALITQLAGTAANLALLGYGRTQELEADRFAAEYLIRAGYDPQGIIRFFEKLRKEEGAEVKGLAVYFRSHPPTSERIRKVKEFLANRQRAAAPRSESVATPAANGGT
ncbi:MAG: M48 family metalloprotease [Armatimonadota bacterium]|nr:M48 family metalloprotease [Armatimonadota bacterium]